jgi:hypothetical protein
MCKGQCHPWTEQCCKYNRIIQTICIPDQAQPGLREHKLNEGHDSWQNIHGAGKKASLAKLH